MISRSPISFAFEPLRDSGLKPTVARNELLPWGPSLK